MPHRDDASFYRGRLYDRDDPEMPDEVTEVLEALDDRVEMAIADGDKETVEVCRRIIDRIADGAGEHYQERYSPGAEEAGA